MKSKQEVFQNEGKKMAVPKGFEPLLAGPKPAVLPLHHGTEWIIN